MTVSLHFFYFIQVRMVRKTATHLREQGVPTGAVVDRLVTQAPAHLQPFPNDEAIVRQVQRAVECPGKKTWPAAIDARRFACSFLRFDNCSQFPGPDPLAVKILATDQGLYLLRNLDWSIDGTFYSAPTPFEQLLIIGYQV
ncbi:hypothetical protein PMAYCL1PPCAC_12603 [Pristionchus mayeri]|uniref:Uncharacterized protein n=1 Tax=Pristionchus mayeri TaxID=1317129 RepID=A0AAN5C959_9BILA|nr:hypothetical protein PMAYCL1PPCAC_12603 [Pristionchus mayeri]